MSLSYQAIQWITLDKFCELTETDLEIVQDNIKRKGNLAQFTKLMTPRARKPLINYRSWMLSVTKNLR